MPKKKTAKSQKIIWIIIAVIFIILFIIYKTTIQPSLSSQPISTTHKKIPFDFADQQFSIDGDVLKFSNGKYSQDERTSSIESRSINPAGNRAAAILIDNPGGSGTFYYLVGAMQTDNGEVYSQPIPLGDRIEIVALSVDDPGAEDNGGIMVEYMDRPANAPMSDAPSVNKTAQFAFEDNGNLISVLH